LTKNSQEVVEVPGYSQQKLSVYKRYIGERLASKYLRKQGFTVQSYMVLSDFAGRSSPYRDYAEKFLGSKKEDFMEMKTALDNSVYSGKEHERRRFDFVAKKRAKYYVIWVKVNTAVLSDLEKASVQLSKKFGFIPMLVRTKVTLIADFKNVVMKTL
jgi:hypothetical protein